MTVDLLVLFALAATAAWVLYSKRGRPGPDRASLPLLTVAMTPATKEAFESLVKRSGASDEAEVVKRALSLYDHVVDWHEDGYTLALARSGEEPIELVLFPDGVSGDPLPDNVVELFPHE